MDEVILKMSGISKNFPGVKALDNVSLNVYPGKVMALMGENGAGKSTLMKILSGVYSLDKGSIHYRNRDVIFESPRAAQENGISIIHQELNLIPHMRIYENIFLGREIKKRTGTLDKKRMIQKSEELLGRVLQLILVHWKKKP